MPTYVYRCKKCKHRFELFHSITDETVKRCPRCKGKAERIPAAGAGILFKGSGFYITDYRSKSYKEQAKKEKPGGASGSSTGSSGSSSGSSGTSSGSSKGDSAGRSSGSGGGASGGA
jgi:putative FmdB family regulatory protein